MMITIVHRVTLCILLLQSVLSCASKEVIKQKKYNRKLFKHWIDANKNCRNTRAETLIRHNQGKLTFKTKKRCVVETGLWYDPYSSKYFIKASNLDIDHIIPLKYSFEHGASKWDEAKRTKFANDPTNTIPVWKKLNRQKGAKDPTKWLPPNTQYQCHYLKIWDELESKYKLNKTNRGPALTNQICRPKSNQTDTLTPTKNINY